MPEMRPFVWGGDVQFLQKPRMSILVTPSMIREMMIPIPHPRPPRQKPSTNPGTMSTSSTYTRMTRESCDLGGSVGLSCVGVLRWILERL